MEFLIAFALILAGLYLVALETRGQQGFGRPRPRLRLLGWALAGFGVLLFIGLVAGRR